MKIKLSFDELSSVLSYVNTILSDKTVDDKMKNVIFLVGDDRATVVGYSALTFSRTELESVELDGVEGSWSFQVKSGELNKIISSYSALYKTKVEHVEFEKYNNKIRVIIHEEAINEEDSRLAQTGRFLLDDVPILESVKKEISLPFPEESDVIISAELQLFIDSLFPLMSNDSANSLNSKMNFSNDYVFVTSSYINSFLVNKLPDAFKGITLGYSSINFLKKLCSGVDNIEVQRVERYLCIQSGSTQAFLKYQKVKIKESSIVSKMSNENGIVLDRLYLKDVLKRMSVSSQDGMVVMSEYGLEVSNSGFAQTIPLNNKKGDVDNLKFKISVPVLSKTIIGDDSMFPPELFLYFVKSANGYIVFVKDATGSWFSTIQVRM